MIVLALALLFTSSEAHGFLTSENDIFPVTIGKGAHFFQTHMPQEFIVTCERECDCRVSLRHTETAGRCPLVDSKPDGLLSHCFIKFSRMDAFECYFNNPERMVHDVLTLPTLRRSSREPMAVPVGATHSSSSSSDDAEHWARFIEREDQERLALLNHDSSDDALGFLDSPGMIRRHAITRGITSPPPLVPGTSNEVDSFSTHALEHRGSSGSESTELPLIPPTLRRLDGERARRSRRSSSSTELSSISVHSEPHD